VSKALAILAAAARGAGKVLPGKAGDVASVTAAALDMASELVSLGASAGDIVHITRVQDIRRMVEQAKAEKN